MKDIPNDYFVYDYKNNKVVGQNTHEEYSFGDEVIIKVIGTDLDKKHIDFKILERKRIKVNFICHGRLFSSFPFRIHFVFFVWPIIFYSFRNQYLQGFKKLFHGLRRGFSDFVFFTVAYLGASKIITEQNQPALFILGGVMLSSYGLLSFIKTQQKKNKIKKGKAVDEQNLISFPIKELLLNIINVAVLFFWTGVLFVIGPKFEMNQLKYGRSFY